MENGEVESDPSLRDLTGAHRHGFWSAGNTRFKCILQRNIDMYKILKP